MNDDTVVIDSSVFVAAINKEPDADRLAVALRSKPRRCMSAGNYLECAMVAEGRFGGRTLLEGWLSRERVEIIAVNLGHARLAADAFAHFGKGRHPAGLNYGDCFAYALAKALNAPLLYKGGDFARTDVASALA
ncbi:MAG TPA: type II toxin-antitoxin system VapC family toxin [Beijerinckiaceae bacterium]|jgi:ribonuclease VapC